MHRVRRSADQRHAPHQATDRPAGDGGIRIGVSLDGGRPAHNAARVDHAGRPGWPAAAAGLRLLAATAPEAYAGVLCVVDLRHDPVAVYESLLAFAPPAIDLLLPHGNWTNPPPGLPALPTDPAPYGRWLTAVFDRWWAADRRETGSACSRSASRCCSACPRPPNVSGLQPFTAAVVETDGSIEQVDSLKSAYEGAARDRPRRLPRQLRRGARPPRRRRPPGGPGRPRRPSARLPLVAVCGGGHYAHRYRAGTASATAPCTAPTWPT